MNQRENILAILRREPYEWMPVEFALCPSLVEEYRRQTGSDKSYSEYFEMPWAGIGDIRVPQDDSQYLGYHPNLKEGATIDLWGVAHEPGSEAAKHMTYMRCPLKSRRIRCRISPPATLPTRKPRPTPSAPGAWPLWAACSAPSGRLPGISGAWRT